MKNVIIYDFDGTLTPYSLPKFEILEKSGMKGGAHNPKFLELSKQKSKDKNIDLYEAMYETYFEIIKSANFDLKDENFCLGYNNVDYNEGVTDFLDMLCQNHVSNYLLSSGIKVFLEKVSVSSYFKKIYATIFNYNLNHEAIGIKFLMSDKNKVIAIEEILKTIGNKDNDCSNVIYIGDGLTDYYAMKYIKEHGGTTIFVYQDPNHKDILAIKEKKVVDFYTNAIYSQNGELYHYVRKLCKINN